MKKLKIFLILAVFVSAMGAAIAENTTTAYVDEIASHYRPGAVCADCDEAGPDNCTLSSASGERCKCTVNGNSSTLAFNSQCKELYEPVAGP